MIELPDYLVRVVGQAIFAAIMLGFYFIVFHRRLKKDASKWEIMGKLIISVIVATTIYFFLVIPALYSINVDDYVDVRPVLSKKKNVVNATATSPVQYIVVTATPQAVNIATWTPNIKPVCPDRSANSSYQSSIGKCILPTTAATVVPTLTQAEICKVYEEPDPGSSRTKLQILDECVELLQCLEKGLSYVPDGNIWKCYIDPTRPACKPGAMISPDGQCFPKPDKDD